MDEQINETANTEINVLMETYADLNDRVRTIKKAKAELKVKIQTFLTLKELDEINTDNVRLTWKEQIRKSLDKEKLNAFLAEHGKGIENFQDEIPSKVLRITRKEDKQND